MLRIHRSSLWKLIEYEHLILFHIVCSNELWWIFVTPQSNIPAAIITLGSFQDYLEGYSSYDYQMVMRHSFVDCSELCLDSHTVENVLRMITSIAYGDVSCQAYGEVEAITFTFIPLDISIQFEQLKDNLKLFTL